MLSHLSRLASKVRHRYNGIMGPDQHAQQNAFFTYLSD
jgi:hypothetical protein